MDPPQVYNIIFLNNLMLEHTKYAYNQRGFSNVTYITANLPRQMLITTLPTNYFAIIGLDNRKLRVVRWSISLTY